MQANTDILEFVVIEPERTTNIALVPVARPITPYTPRSPQTRDLHYQSTAFMLSRLFGWPVTHCQIEQRVGSFALVHYTLYKTPDPNIVISFDNPAFNRAVVSFQGHRVRERWSSFDPAKWLRRAQWYVAHLERVLKRARVTPAEYRFVMEWVQGVTSGVRTIQDHPKVGRRGYIRVCQIMGW